MRIGWRGGLPEPAHVEFLGKAGADQKVAVGREAGDREIADDLAGLRQHRGQRNAAWTRQLAGQQMVQPGPRPRAGNLVFAVVRGLVNADRLAHRLAFGPDMGESVGAAIGRRFRRLNAFGRKPQSMFQPEIRAHDRASREQPVMDRGAPRRAGFRQFLIGKSQAKPAAIVFVDFQAGVFWRGEGTKARHIHRQHIGTRIIARHPPRQDQPDAAALRKPRHHGAGHPVVPDAPHRPDQRIAIGRKSERPVDGPFDAGPTNCWKMLEPDVEFRSDAVEIIGQELHRKIIRRAQRRPGDAGFLVSAEQSPPALLAHIDFAGIIGCIDDFFGQARQFRNRFGDDIHMLHGQHRQVHPRHRPDFAGPQPAAIDDMLGVDRSFVGSYIPRPVRALRQPLNTGEAVDFSAELAGRHGIGLRDAGRIAMAAIGPPQRPGEIAGVDQAIALLGLFQRDHPRRHAEIAGAAAQQLQRIHLALAGRQHQPAIRVQPARLARQVLKLAVKIDGVFLQPRDIGIAVERVHAARRMPGGPRRQFGFFEQHHIAPADFGQMIEHARPDHAAADDHCPGCRAHSVVPLRVGPGAQ